MKYTRFCLCACLLALSTLTAASAQTSTTATASTMEVRLDGAVVAPAGYLIDGYNYYKLRDIAYLLSATESRFSVGWDEDLRVITIEPFEDYTATGEEMQGALSGEISAVLSALTLLKNDEIITPKGYVINGNTYFSLRDLGDALGFSVGYDDATRTIYVNTPPSLDTEDEHEGDLPDWYDDFTDADTDTDAAPEIDYDRVDGELIIVLDAGHGGTEPGTSATAFTTFTLPDGTTVAQGDTVLEKTLNRFVTDYLEEMLVDAGVTVIQTRPNDETVDATARQELLREYGVNADMIFSIHHNAASNTEALGAEVLVQIAYEDGGAGMEFAALLEAEYEEMGQYVRNTVYKHHSQDDTLDYYFVLRAAQEVNALAFISEFCFLSNEEDQQWVYTEEQLIAQAQAQFDAIMTYFETAPY